MEKTKELVQYNADTYEIQYQQLIEKILNRGELREGRNGKTYSLFGETLTFDLANNNMPLLNGRQIFYKSVLGELAALLRQPKTIEDFKKFGCNYWDLWAKDNGDINVDYGNKWIDWNGVNQLDNLIETLKTNPTDRRMIITGWDPSNIEELDLPCCHYTYQWYVREGKHLDMLWHQRSVDTMIGLPSDAVFAAAWNIAIANEVGLAPGRVTMTLGDTHIYEEHKQAAMDYLNTDISDVPQPKFELLSRIGKKTIEFIPEDLEITNYEPRSKVRFELKS